jgi:hypothetical protein
MAGLGLKIDVQKLERLVQLREEIEKLKTSLRGMNGDANSKEFEALNKRLQQASKECEKLSQKLFGSIDALRDTRTEVRESVSDFDRFQKLLVKIGGATLFINLAKQIVDVRNEFQQLEIAFTTMLKSKEKATKLMQDLTKFAAETPFGLQSAATGAKQLIAYGSTAETVIDELRMMGDVAAGTGQQLGDIVYLYGTLRTQGRAYLMDIRQFAGRGIPIYDELAKVLGVSKDKVNEFVTAGKVGFKEVEQAFKNMTASGGLYGGLMEEQSKSIGGRIEQLKDNISSAYNEIGKSSEGVIYTAIDLSSKLVENYEAIGEALAALIVTYGSYRAALIVHSALKKAYNAELMRQAVLEQQRAASLGINMTLQQAQNTVIAAGTVQVKLHTLAQQRLAKAMNATKAALATNIYALAAAAVVALGYGIYKLATYTTQLEKASKDYNRELASEETLLKVLVDRFKSTKKGSGEYEQSKKELNERYGEALKSIGLEAEALYDSVIAYMNLTNEIEKNTKAKIRNKYVEQFSEESARNIGDRYSDIRNRILRQIQGDAGKEVFQSVKDIIANSDINTRGWDLEKQFKALNLNWMDYSKDVYGILSSQYKLKKDIEEIDDIFGKPSSKGDGGGGEKTIISTLADQAKDAKKKVEDLTEELKKLKSGATASDDYAKDIKEKAEELKKAQETLDLLEGRDKTTDKQTTDANRLKAATAERIRQIEESRKRIAEQQKAGELELRQHEIDQMDEGTAKTLAQIDLNYEKREAEIIKKGEELIKAQQKLEEDIWKVQNPNWEKDGKVFTPSTTSISQLSEKDKDYLADSFLANNKVREKAQADLLKSLMEQYQDFDTQRKSLERSYNEDIKTLNDSRTAENAEAIDRSIAEAKRQMVSSLAELDNEYSKTTHAISELFNDMAGKSAEDMRTIADEAKAMMEFVLKGEWNKGDAERFGIATEEIFKNLNEEWAKSPKELEAVKKALANLYREADKAETPFKKIENGLKRIFDAGDDINELKEGLAVVSEGFSEASELVGMFADSLRNIGEMAKSDMLSSIADGLSEIVDVAGSTIQGAVAGASFGGIGAIVGGALGFVSSITSLFSNSISKSAELERQVRESQMQAYLGEIEINQLYRERYEWAKKIGESQLEYIRRQGEELRRQAEANTKDADKLWEKLMAEGQAKTGYGMEKASSRPGDWKVVETWGSLAGKTWEEIEMLAAQGKLSEETMKIYEALRKAKEEGWDLAASQEDYLKNVQEMTTGSTYESVVNGIVEGFKAGKRSAADFADTFDELMQNAVVSALSLLTDDKMQQWYEDFYAMGEDGYTDEEIAKAKEDYLRYVEELAEEARRLEEVTGIVIGNKEAENENSLRGAFAKASQESIDLLAGQTGAQRKTIEDILVVLRERLTTNTDYVNSVTGNLLHVNEILGAALVELRGIRELNEKISESNARISELSGQISDNTKRSANALDNIGQNGLKVNIPGIL